MQKIGTGYWYHVFDLGNGRVLKREKTAWEKIKEVYYLEQMRLPGWLRASAILLFGRNRVKKSYDFIRTVKDQALLANPKFLGGLDYEQDLIEPAADLYRRADRAGQDMLVDAYINCILECWKHGFMDQSFSFNINYGRDSRGRLVVIDFNEVVTSKQGAEWIIRNRLWRKSLTIRRADDRLRRTIMAKLQQRLTPQALEANWGKS